MFKTFGCIKNSNKKKISGEAEKTTDTFLKSNEVSMKYDQKYNDELYQNNDDFSLMNVDFSLRNKDLVQEKINLDSNRLQKDEKILSKKSDVTLEEEFDSNNNLKSSSNDFIPLFWMLIPSIIILL